MPILYVYKTTVRSLDTDGEPASKLPNEIKTSEWNLDRKKIVKDTIFREKLADGTGEFFCSAVLFDNIDAANEFVKATTPPEDIRILLSDWKASKSITYEHKFYNVTNPAGDILDTLSLVTDADIEPSIDTSSLH